MPEVVVTGGRAVADSGKRQYPNEPAAKQPWTEMNAAHRSSRRVECKRTEQSFHWPIETSAMCNVLYVFVLNPLSEEPSFPAGNCKRLPLPSKGIPGQKHGWLTDPQVVPTVDGENRR